MPANAAMLLAARKYIMRSQSGTPGVHLKSAEISASLLSIVNGDLAVLFMLSLPKSPSFGEIFGESILLLEDTGDVTAHMLAISDSC